MSPQTAGVEFAIRPYRPADFDRLWEIDQLCFPEGVAYSQMDLSGFVTQRNSVTLVAEAQEKGNGDGTKPSQGPDDAGRIVGFVVAHRRRKAGRIITLDVLPEARRYGLATRLMETCEEKLRSSNCELISLETAVNNEAAVKLYEKLGYTIVDTIPEYYSSHALDAFVMAKRL